MGPDCGRVSTWWSESIPQALPSPRPLALRYPFKDRGRCFCPGWRQPRELAFSVRSGGSGVALTRKRPTVEEAPTSPVSGWRLVPRPAGPCPFRSSQRFPPVPLRLDLPNCRAGCHRVGRTQFHLVAAPPRISLLTPSGIRWRWIAPHLSGRVWPSGTLLRRTSYCS